MGSQEFWEADEVYGTLPPNATQEDVEALFDLLWDVFDRADMTSQEREVDLVRRIREYHDTAEQAAAQAWFTAVITGTEVGE